MRRAVLAVPVALVAWGLACGGDSTTSTTPDASMGACVPWQSIACVGVGGCSGGQSCKSDGSGYGDCACGPSPDSGIDASMDSAGAPDASDSGCTGAKIGGLVAWWKGENSTNDELGGVPLTIMGSVGYAAGKVGQGFDLTGGYLKGTASPTLDNLPAITVEAWILAHASSANALLISRRVNTGFAIQLNASQLEFSVDGTGQGQGTGTVPTDTLTHVAVTYDPTLSSNQYQFYVNGVVSNGAEGNGVGLPNDSATIYIGTFYALGSIFSGVIDELAIYNVALKASDIAAIYSAGANGKCK